MWFILDLSVYAANKREVLRTIHVFLIYAIFQHCTVRFAVGDGLIQ